MKKTIVTLTVLLGLAGISVAQQQQHFTTSGTIEFERRTNVFAMIKNMINKDNEVFLSPALDAYKKNNPQFRILKSILSFSDNKTLFTPVVADPPANALMALAPLMNQNNIVYSDLDEHLSISEKKVFDDLFLVKDSTRKIKWKITDETRDIAGYTCRRANGIMMDSIYVVAFFTGKIPIPGGPEAFNGLPGMILGVAIPHENVSWFATKVTDTTITPSILSAPKNGKVLDNNNFGKMLEKALKDQGAVAKDLVRDFSL